MDEKELKVGDSIMQQIADGILDCHFCIALLSKESTKSKWVKKELQLAMTSEVVSTKLKVLPLRVDNCKVPTFLSDKLYLDLQGQEYEMCLSKLFCRVREKRDVDGNLANVQIEVVSLDLDNALCNNAMDEYLWRHLIPKLYGTKKGISFEEAFNIVTSEYAKLWGAVGGAWRDPDYWFKKFQLGTCLRAELPRLAPKFFIYPDVAGALKQLKEQYRLILVSGAARELMDYKLKRGGISTMFSKTYSVSTDCDLAAKYESAYIHVCRDLQVSPDRVFHCGDNMVFDVEIPKRLGMQAVLLDRRAAQRDRKVLTNLRDLIVLLDSFRNDKAGKRLRGDIGT